MARRRQHDLYALFAFALRENDWELANLLASVLLDHEAIERRLQGELATASKGAGAPQDLKTLRHWATIARSITPAR